LGPPSWPLPPSHASEKIKTGLDRGVALGKKAREFRTLWSLAFGIQDPSPLCWDGLAEIFKKIWARCFSSVCCAHELSRTNRSWRGEGDQEAPYQANGNVETENAEEDFHLVSIDAPA
jgi:hypothetical protein